ncbi:hypothetical protein ACJO2E_14785 [Marinobacter sp. M1N3S26]|uniref:hypothetical protein n=1 Tax=Marinobacter sp. M1N3S26 TaxID=3382299 RepID=UPI00387B41A6
MKVASIASGIVFLLTACSYQTEGVVSAETSASTDREMLQPVRAIELNVPETLEDDGLGPGLHAFDISDNGHYLLSILGTRQPQGESYSFVNWLELYDVTTGELIHRDIPAGNTGEMISTGGFLGSGLYFVESAGSESQRPSDIAASYVQVFSVDPQKELARLSIGGVTHGRGQYLFTSASRSVVNWKTQESYSAQFYPRFGINLMTDEGAVLSTSMDGAIALHNPVLDELLQWESDLEAPRLLLTADDGYVVAQGDDFRCKVWKLPGIEEVDQCPRSFGSEGQKRATAMHPEKPLFALAWDEKVRLYNLDPFEMVQEIVIPDPVLGLFLTDNRLVIASRQGLQVWGIEKAMLHAEAEVPIHHRDSVRVSHNGFVAIVLDQDPDNPESAVRPVWIYELP